MLDQISLLSAGAILNAWSFSRRKGKSISTSGKTMDSIGLYWFVINLYADLNHSTLFCRWRCFISSKDCSPWRTGPQHPGNLSKCRVWCSQLFQSVKSFVVFWLAIYFAVAMTFSSKECSPSRTGPPRPQNLSKCRVWCRRSFLSAKSFVVFWIAIYFAVTKIMFLYIQRISNNPLGTLSLIMTVQCNILLVWQTINHVIGLSNFEFLSG